MRDFDDNQHPTGVSCQFCDTEILCDCDNTENANHDAETRRVCDGCDHMMNKDD